MNQKIYTCARCKKKISRVVETCQKCLKDFHPCCTKLHKIYNSEGFLVPCDGEGELFNRNIVGDKQFRRRRTLSAEYESDELELDKSLSENNVKDNDYSQNDNNSESYTSNISIQTFSKKIEDMFLKNSNELKLFIQQCIREEMNCLKGIFKEIIASEVSKNTEELKKEIQIQEKSTVSQLNQQSNGHDNHNNNSSYSSVIKRAKAIPTIKSIERVVIVPTKQQESNVTINQLKNNIDIINLGVGVNKVKSKARGKVVLEVEKENEKAVLASEIQNKFGDHFRVNVIKKKNPMLKIVGLEENIMKTDDDTFINNLCRQNSWEASNNSIKITKKFMTKQGYGSFLLEVSPVVHKMILMNNSIKIGWKNYKVYNHVNVVRCFKCWGFNHFANKCNKPVICRLCAEKHSENECDKNVSKCINCVEWVKKFKSSGISVDHVATDWNCECYKQKMRQEQSNILENKQ